MEPQLPTVEMRSAGDGAGVVCLRGDWSLRGGIPSVDTLAGRIDSDSLRRLTVDADSLGHWDTSLLLFLDHLEDACRKRGTQLDRSGLPDGVRRLEALAEAVPERAGARAAASRVSILARIGNLALKAYRDNHEMLDFVGQVAVALGRWVTGRARYRRSDLLLFMQQAGADALPIVTLISFLVGLILAFVGAIQLKQFGASIYVADMVGIGMVREMGAMMTGIVMAGRTGAAYAAQLGSMKVNQEIDSLSTMGISPMEFLVLPRLIALTAMMPLLCLYSDFIGILGGATVGIGMLHLSPTTYIIHTEWAVTLKSMFGGLFKATVYGALVALAGCLRGMQSGNSSSAVGDATTAAVVTSIVAIISACGVFAVTFYVLGL
ncbi:MAG: ABC transporter permease [Deltaproteobacteria bacterium]|nr:ABC transporter permease [Deltaproteobacteria bacterium]